MLENSIKEDKEVSHSITFVSKNLVTYFGKQSNEITIYQ
jgi:hypothetical protein